MKTTTRTKTKTKTKSVTGTQIGVATFALFLATAASFAVAPASLRTAAASAVQCTPSQVEYSNPCQKRVNGQMVGGFRRAHYICPGAPDQKGFNMVSSCMTPDQLSSLIASNCSRRNQCANVVPPEERPQLRVSVDADTPLPTNVILGEADRQVAKFDITNSSLEDVSLRKLTVSFNVANASGADAVRNIRLFDEQGVQMGQSVAVSVRPQANSSYALVPFDLNYTLPHNTTKRITVKVDVAPFDRLNQSGVRFQAAILSGDVDASVAGTQLSLEGMGLRSGTPIQPGDVTFVANAGTIALGRVSEGNRSPLSANANHVRANEMVAYRSKVTASWSGDTPSGYTAPSAQHVVAKFAISNFANLDNSQIVIKYLNISIASTISNTQDRILNIYKDSLNTTPLGTTTFLARVASRPQESFGNTGFGDADVGDVEVGSGAIKTFFVTLDTTEASTDKTLSLSLPSSQVSRYGSRNGSVVYGLVWSDGIIDDIAAHDNVLPLNFKTLVY